ncbi:uncharacterized protein [Montipora capricornis]|uniref:uncharacterized protein isoform X1 n=2 Tax=Montipora capricornis TaxID=246305 RepID=UPI0035F0FD3F
MLFQASPLPFHSRVLILNQDHQRHLQLLKTREKMENEQINITMIANPTDSLDPPASTTETVEVGVIVIGFCCICLVACALVILQLRSNNRRNTGNRPQRQENVGETSRDRTGVPLDVEAPPSYDAVIRSPHLYPPSRRSSITLHISDTRRSSASSTFNLSQNSLHFNHHRQEALGDSSENSVSQHSHFQPRESSEGETEEPPPPYPGIVTLLSPPNAFSVEHICGTNARALEEVSMNETSHTVNADSTENERTNDSPSNQRHVIAPGRTLVYAWTDIETELRVPQVEINEASRTHSCQSSCDMRNSIENQTEIDASRTALHSGEQTPRARREGVSNSGKLLSKSFRPKVETVETL